MNYSLKLKKRLIDFVHTSRTDQSMPVELGVIWMQ